MLQQDEREYFQHRQRASEENARKASDPAVAYIHRELAARYAKRLGQDMHGPAE